MTEKYFTPFSKQELLPKEERIDFANKKGSYKIGIPKEEDENEKRICLTPDAVSVLVANGHEVCVESGAGLGSQFQDFLYSEAGANIVYDKKTVFNNPLLLKVQPPTEQEIELMQQRAFLFSSIQLNKQEKSYFEALNKKKITALSFEHLRDRHNNLSLLRLISEIAGTGSILLASELLSSTNGGTGLLLGGITGVRPTEIVILGAGTVSEFATRAAIGLGAVVKVFDNSLTRLRRLQNQLGRISTSTVDPKELMKVLKRADVVIAAVRGNERVPIWVTEEMVQEMKPGSIIIDVSIDQGTCVETSEVTTHQFPTRIKYDVIHYGVPNVTSRYSRTTSKAVSNFFLSYFLDLANKGNLDDILTIDQGIKQGIYAYKGKCTNKQIAERFNLNFQDINLLIF
jgi:alanine dehydrogenase